MIEAKSPMNTKFIFHENSRAAEAAAQSLEGGQELILYNKKHPILFRTSLIILVNIRKGDPGVWQHPIRNHPHVCPFPKLQLYLLNWESELLAKSLDWGKLDNVTVCCGAEGRSEAVVGTTLGREPAEGEGSVLGAGIDEVAVTS